MLYDSLVLRRTMAILTLAGQEERYRKLRFSAEEQKHYDQTIGIIELCIRNQVGEHEAKGNFVFHAHLQLRLLCNHGTHQKLCSWGMNGSNANGRDAMLAELGLNAEEICVGCSQPLPVITSNNTRSDFVEKCAHIFCRECSDGINASQTNAESLGHCPLCAISRTALKNASSRPEAGNPDESGDVIMGEAPIEENDDGAISRGYLKRGLSTKMNVLLKDVKETLEERPMHGSFRETKR